VPPELELDEFDPSASHALAYQGERCIGTARLVHLGNGQAQIGRMAVSKALRGGNLGRMVMDALTDVARQRGDQQIILHAQCSAEPFYRRLGFKAHGEVFQDACIDHIEMTLQLA